MLASQVELNVRGDATVHSQLRQVGWECGESFSSAECHMSSQALVTDDRQAPLETPNFFTTYRVCVVEEQCVSTKMADDQSTDWFG